MLIVLALIVALVPAWLVLERIVVRRTIVPRAPFAPPSHVRLIRNADGVLVEEPRR